MSTDGSADGQEAMDLHAAVKEKEDIAQEAEALTVEKQTTAATAGTRAAAVAGQAAFQGTMRATVRIISFQAAVHTLNAQHLNMLPCAFCVVGAGQCRHNTYSRVSRRRRRN